MRKTVSLAAALLLSVGLVVAGEHRGILQSVDGNNVTFMKFTKKGEKPTEVTLPVASNAKIVKGTRNAETKKLDAGEALDGGLKNAAVKKGAFIAVVTDADDKNITEIRVGEEFKRKKQ